MKELADMTKPDPRNRLFMRQDGAQGNWCPLTLEYYHECAARISLNAAVPRDVRDYLETVKNLFVYGWFFYPFCTMAGHLSTFVLEMALRKRMDTQGSRKPGLKSLLQNAIEKGLIDGEWATCADKLDRWEFVWNADMTPEPAGPRPTNLQAQAIADQRVQMRNAFAHPEYEPVSVPDDALWSITISSAIINQLWSH